MIYKSNIICAPFRLQQTMCKKLVLILFETSPWNRSLYSSWFEFRDRELVTVMWSRFIQTFGNVSYILCLNLKWQLIIYYLWCSVQNRYLYGNCSAMLFFEWHIEWHIWHLAITTGLDCSHLSRYICIKLQVLVVLFKSMTNWASLFTQPRQQARVDCIFHCSE